MIRTAPLVTVLAAVLLLSACKTTEDPSKGGFLSGMANLSDGTYDRRQQERHQELGAQQAANQSQQAELAHVSAEARETAAQLAETQARYAAMRSDLDALSKKLGGAKGRNSALVQRVHALEAKVAMVDQDTFSPVEEKRKRLEALQREKAVLEKEADLALRR